MMAAIRSSTLIFSCVLLSVHLPFSDSGPHASAGTQYSKSGYVIGVYKRARIIDGDTFDIDGLGSIRLLSIDTEESPKHGNAQSVANALRIDWRKTYQLIRMNAPYPVKPVSPFGYETTLWTKEWMKDVDSIRLERDIPSNVHDRYNRYLAYVIVHKQGREINYNIECVRQGYSPYSGKYGFSKRFHNEFLRAQEEARVNKRGIWNEESHCYPDYDERLAWWNARGRAIEEFDRRFSRNPRYYFMSRDGELERLSLAVGKSVVVFGTIDQIQQRRFPYLVDLSHKDKSSLPVVFFQSMKSTFERIPWKSFDGHYLYVRGRVVLFNGQVNLVPSSPDDVSLTPLDRPDSG